MKANIFFGILTEKKTDNHLCIIRIKYPNSHLYWLLKGKEKSGHDLVLYCQLSKKVIL